MSINQLRNSLGVHAKDISLNLGSILETEGGAADLSDVQRDAVALASAYATQNSAIIKVFEDSMSSEMVQAAKAASTIMAMNNVYYRFVHLVNDTEINKLPARLRMNVIANPGVDKIDFELMCMAVSAINGCGMCMESHMHELLKAGITRTGVQSAVRIAAVINAAAQAEYC